MNDENKLQETAAKVANNFAIELGKALVMNNCERSKRRFLRVLDELTNGGNHVNRKVCNDVDSSSGDLKS